MHLRKVIGVLGVLMAICSGEVNDVECSRAPTTYSTVFATVTVTETVTLDINSVTSIASGMTTPTAVGTSNQPPSPSTVSEQVELTTTIYETQTFTSDISLIEASLSTSASATSGLYFFSVDNGTTIWLGGQTPPLTVSYVLVTSTVFIEPVPLNYGLASTAHSTGLSTEAVVTLSTDTIQATNILTTILTQVVTEPGALAPVTAHVGGFRGTGIYGWNATSPYHHKETVTPTLAHAHPRRPTGVLSGSAARLPKFRQMSSQVPSVWHGSDKRDIHHIGARQAGAIVVATINDVVVSWTNNYFGAATFTPDVSIPTSVISEPLTNLPSVSSPAPKEPSSSPIQFSSSLLSATIPNEAPSLSLAGIRSSISDTSTNTRLPVWTLNPPSIINPLSTTTRHQSTFSMLSFITSTISRAPTTLEVYSVSPLPTQPLSSTSVESSSVPPFRNITTASSTLATPTATVCNVPDLDIGDFEINFDDLPQFSASPDDTDYPPIFSPYHNLYWSEGFAYAPPPSDPYAPVSSPQLGVFVTNTSSNVHPSESSDAPSPGSLANGEFGAGPNYADSAFWFNAYSAYVGCSNEGPENCEITINGYGYEPEFDNTVLIARTTTYQLPCVGLVNCTLVQVEFGEEFRNLTALGIIASIGNSPLMQTWYMDNLMIGWSNNTCDAAEVRAATPL